MTLQSTQILVGITGGIACGKSSALREFQKLGWAGISADNIAGEILSSDGPVRLKILERWGPRVLRDCGNIDKSVIGGIVFKSERERKWIGNLLHPIIRTRWLSFAQSCASEKCMIELPLLFENEIQNYFKYTITTYSPLSMIYNRLNERGLSTEDATVRVHSQLELSRKVQFADFILWGGGSMEFLHRQVRELDGFLSQD